MNILFSEISCMVGDLMHMRFDAQVISSGAREAEGRPSEANLNFFFGY